MPDCFGKWPNLGVLNLAYNNLSGKITGSVGSLVSLEMFSVHNNTFSGGLPSSLKSCGQLKFLDVSDNRLSGVIPVWIGQSLPSLVFLSLHANQFNGSIPHQPCGLNYIQILDFSVNKISGSIPHCFYNFTSMAQQVTLNTTIEHNLGLINLRRFRRFSLVNYIDEALLEWKRKEREYDRILGLLLVVDLSSNELRGEFPQEITSLSGLVAFNLSRNNLVGRIPQNTGHLRRLQSLDLSRDRLSGNFPTSMSELTFLGHLDLSYDHLSGEIPSSTLLQNLDASAFAHNFGLCGPTVAPSCLEAKTPVGQPANFEEDGDELLKFLYAGMGTGFFVGFWGLCGVLLFKRSGDTPIFGSWTTSTIGTLQDEKRRIIIAKR